VGNVTKFESHISPLYLASHLTNASLYEKYLKINRTKNEQNRSEHNNI